MATKQDPAYTLTGRITNLQGQSIQGLTVRVFDRGSITSDPLGEATTDAAGGYTIRFSTKALNWEFGGPDVYIQVYRDGTLLGQSPVYPDQKQEITINLQVDQANP